MTCDFIGRGLEFTGQAGVLPELLEQLLLGEDPQLGPDSAAAAALIAFSAAQLQCVGIQGGGQLFQARPTPSIGLDEGFGWGISSELSQSRSKKLPGQLRPISIGVVEHHEISAPQPGSFKDRLKKGFIGDEHEHDGVAAPDELDLAAPQARSFQEERVATQSLQSIGHQSGRHDSLPWVHVGGKGVQDRTLFLGELVQAQAVTQGRGRITQRRFGGE